MNEKRFKVWQSVVPGAKVRWIQTAVQLACTSHCIGRKSIDFPARPLFFLQKLRKFGICVAGGLFAFNTMNAQAFDHTNFLVITIDDLKRVVGVMADRPGNLLHQIYPDSQVRAAIKSVLTPNMDQLANNGVLFTNAYAVAPVCNPSRIAIATGTRPDLTGFTTNKVLFRDEPGGVALTTMQQNLKNQGYYTSGIGKIFHSSKVVLAADGQSIAKDWPDSQYSWDTWVNRSTGSTGQITFSPYSTSSGKIRFGSLDSAVTQQFDYINAGFIADLLEDGSATIYDTVYSTDVTVNLPVNSPFYLGLGIYLPHQPFVAPPEILNLFNPDDMQIDADSLLAVQNDLLDLSDGGKFVTGADGQITTEFQVLLQRGLDRDGPGGDIAAWKDVIKHYLASVVVADRALGVALDALAASQYQSNTVVVLHSDHGFNLGEKNRLDKNDVWDESTGSVLMVSGPGVLPKVVESSVSLLDIYPTVTSLAGVNLPAYVLGNDLSPFLFNDNEAWSKPSFTTQGAQANRHSVRTDNYRYVRFLDDPANAELYDIRVDPDEANNEIDTPGYQPVRQALDYLLDSIRSNSTSTPVIVQPLDVLSNTGELTSLQIESWQAAGEKLYFSAVGLPVGLVIDSETGLIAGTATVAGNFYPVLTASSPSGATSVSLNWAVSGDAPSDPPYWDSGEVNILQITENSLTVDWSGAVDDVALASYRIYYQAVGGATETLDASESPVELNGLLSGTQYQIEVQAIDSDGYQSTDGPVVVVSTLDRIDSVAPVWINPALVATDVTETSISVSWSGATDNTGVTEYRVELVDSQGTSASTVEGAGLTFNSLTAGNTYLISVRAMDAEGNISVDGPSGEITTVSIDSQAPYWLADDEISVEVETTLLAVTWPVAQDNVAVTGYDVTVDGNLVTTTVSNSLTIVDLQPGVSYDVSVSARDATGNISLQPLAVVVSTQSESTYSFQFSTLSATRVGGIVGTPDDAHVYSVSGDNLSLLLDSNDAGLVDTADIDALVALPDGRFLVSLIVPTSLVPGLGPVTDRDILEYHDGVWSIFIAGQTMGLSSGGHDIDALDIDGNDIYFSILGAISLPGIGVVDDADVLKWNGTAIEKAWDASDNGLPSVADVDGLDYKVNGHYFLSFNAATTVVPTIGSVSDEDIVEYNNGVWSLFFDGSEYGLTKGGHDIDAFTFGTSLPEQDEQAPSWVNGQITVVEKSSNSIEVEWTQAQDNIAVTGYLVDVNNGSNTFTRNIIANNVLLQDFLPETQYTITVEALDQAGNVSIGGPSIAVVTDEVIGESNDPSLNFSILGSASLPTISGSSDDADLYVWDNSEYSLVLDGTAIGLPGAADVDAATIASDGGIVVSFLASNTTVPGLGVVRDEDLVKYLDGEWSLFFDGSDVGLTSGGHDIDAVSVFGGTIYLSTLGATTVPGLIAPDDADIYQWNENTFVRVFDASAEGLPGNADIDALVVINNQNFLMSFNASNTNIPDIGKVQDEDIVEYNNGSWSIYFDGTANGLTSGGHDIDAAFLQ